MSRLIILQPYVPAYRKPFFDGVVRELATRGHECLVVTGTLSKKRASRGDAVTAPWHRQHRGFSFKLKGRHFRSYGGLVDMLKADAVIAELAVGAVDTHLARVTKLRRRRLGLWGHVGHYTGQTNGLFQRVETGLIQNADAIFAYTTQGAQAAVLRGASPATTFALENTVDMSGLISAMGSNSDLDRAVENSRTFAFIGGLDASKRIEFLVAVFDRLWDLDPSVRVQIGGRGAQESLLLPAVQRGQVTLLGRVGDAEKAALARSSVALLNPGRVGLLAPESFVLGLPIVTTEWPFHAPEFSYLTPGVDCVVTKNTVEDYADAILRLANEPEWARRLASNASSKSGWPTLKHMIDTFVDGASVLLR